MPQSRFLRRFLFAVIVFGGAWGVWWWSRPPRLNVLLVTLDTTRADRVGSWGGPAGVTPVLDALASQGIVFERAYAPVPLTLPSHISLMTGLNPPEHGIRLNSGLSRLADEVPVLAEILKRQGYSTGAFVGAFVLDSKYGLDRGFDVYDDEIRHLGEPAMSLDSHSHPSRVGEEVVSSALKWLFEQKNESFFCWVHLFDPHTPYDAREQIFGDRYRDHEYDAGIAYADMQVGRLMQFLQRQGLEERTVVVIVGDHGEGLGEHQERTHGLTLYNASLHVPMIMRFPRSGLRAGRVSTPVSLIDVFPTVLAELNTAETASCSGRNLLPAVLGGELPSLPVYIETDHPFGEGGWAPQRGLISENWKYIRSPRPELYKLAEDPHELNNLAELHKEEVSNFEEMLLDRESSFVYRDTQAVILSSEDQRKLASLGYTGGESPTGEHLEGLADIKDMIGYYNSHSDATVLFMQGRFAEAQKILEDVVQDVPDYAQAWLFLGTSHLEQGHIEEARTALERSVEINGDPTTRIVLGKFYLTQNKPEKALAQLETAVRMRPQSTTGHYFLAEAFRAQGESEKARRHYLRTLELSPGFPLAEEALKMLP